MVLRSIGLVGSTLAIWIGVWGTPNQSVQAVQRADGTVFFNHPPRLVNARTTENTIRAFTATYYFTLSLPEDAGEPLRRVTITQREGTDTVRFNLKKTQAFGERRREGLNLGNVTDDKGTQSVSVVFEPPVQPGKTVTIGLRPRHNPDFSGVYLFGVTAFPQGEKAYGQFLGFGRLHFYGGDSSSFFRR